MISDGGPGYTPTGSPRSTARFKSNVAWGTLANLALPVTALLTGPLLARGLAPAGRGELASLTSIIAFTVVVGVLGLPEAGTYFVSSRRMTPVDALRAGAPVVITASAICVATVYVLAPVLLGHNEDLVHLCRTALLLVPIALAIAFARGTVIGLQRFGFVYFEQTASAIVRTVLIAGLAVAGTLTTSSAMWATLLPGIVVALILVPPLLGSRARSLARGRRASADLGAYGVRSSGGTIAGLANQWLDQVLLLPLAGARELGYYAVAVSLAGISNALTMAVGRVLLPTAGARGDWDVVWRAVRATVIAVSVFGLLGICLTPVVVPLLFGAEFQPAVAMASILFIAMIPGAAAVVLGAGFAGLGRPGTMSIAQAIGLVVTLAALFLLAPGYGGVGAAVASLAAYSTTFLVLLIAAGSQGQRVMEALRPRAQDVRSLTPVLGRKP